MRVAIDVSSLAREGLTGIGVYIAQLVRELVAGGECDVRAVYRPRLHEKRAMIARHLPVAPSPWMPLLSDLRVDLYHGPDFRLPRVLAVPSVVTIHDLAVFTDGLLDPMFALRGREKISRLIERRPDRIIAVSEFTRDEIARRFPAIADRVDAVPLGVDMVPAAPATETLPAGARPPYLLSLGTLERRKNVTASIEALELLRDRAIDVRLVVAGADGYDAGAIVERIERSAHRESIVRRGFVRDDERRALLRHAEMLVYPSLYEGFGLPVLEAMASGCPVVTSSSGAVAEVAGDAALLVAPEAAAIADAALRILTDASLRSRLLERGRLRAAAFTWRTCAERTISVYSDVLER
jgi:alpha-1,3-rhamnosyl/mannosyltransferase